MTATDIENGETDPQLDRRLCDAAWAGDVEQIKELCLLGANIECFNDNGNTPLHLAIEQGNYEAVNTLLELGADIERRTRLGDWTPLLHAVEVVSDAAIQLRRPADNRLIRLLLDYGADVHQRCLDGDSAIGLAREFTNAEAEEILREAGAKE